MLAFVLGLALLAGAPTPAETRPTWVFFVDKGVRSDALDDALARRAAELSPRALARRQRTRGDHGVDVRDLPIAPRHLAALAAAGVHVRTHSRWLNAVSVDADPATLEQLAQLHGVRTVSPVARGHRELPIVTPAPVRPGPAPEGIALAQLDQLGIPELALCGLTGEGVLVGVLDTGFQLDHLAFAELDVVASHDFVDDDDVVAFEPGDVDGQFFHGSWVLSLLAGRDDGSYRGAAPGVSVLLAKTEDYGQEVPIEEDFYVEGLEWIEGMGADMTTSSLGYIDWYTAAQMDGQTAVTSVAASVALDNGLIMFTAMGNSGPAPTTLIAPADTDGLVSIGAVDAAGIVTDFSSRGPTADLRTKPDVCGGGYQVWVVDLATTDQYGQGSGTSFATPLVAGLGALLLEAYPGTTPAEMLDLLHSTASQALAPDDDYGWGIAGGVAAAAAYCDCLAIELCEGGLDEDCDGLVDHDDPECAVGTSSSGDASTSGGASSTTDAGPTSSGTPDPTAADASSSGGATTELTTTATSTLDGSTATPTDSSGSSGGIGEDSGGGCGCSQRSRHHAAIPLLLVLTLGPRRARASHRPAPAAGRIPHPQG